MKLRSNLITITCDGGAATGKSTGAKLIAKKYMLPFMSSGLLYRFIAFKVLKLNKKKIDFSFIKKIAKNINSQSLQNSKLYSPSVTEYTIKIAKIYKVRKILRSYQNKFNIQKLDSNL